MNLYPNMTRQQYDGSEDFIYAGPVPTEQWVMLQKFALRTPERVGYVTSDEVKGLETVVIILRDTDMSDDDCLAAGAYVRIVSGQTGRIYVVPHTTHVSQASIIAATGGAPRKLCKLLDMPDLYYREEVENREVETTVET